MKNKTDRLAGSVERNPDYVYEENPPEVSEIMCPEGSHFPCREWPRNCSELLAHYERYHPEYGYTKLFDMEQYFEQERTRRYGR